MIAQSFCNRCNSHKDEDAFYWNRGKPRPECILCTKRRNRKYNVENRQKKRAINQRYEQANLEHVQKYHREYYTVNRDKILDRSRDRYSSVIGRAAILFNSAKRRAERIGLEFSLSLARIEVSLLLGTCERTKIPFDFTSSSETWRNQHSPSIDRIDSFRGYTDDNIKVVVSMYNCGKGQHTDDEFIAFCHAVASNNPMKSDREKCK